MSLTYPGSEAVKINSVTPPGCKPLNRPEPILKADALSYLIWDIPDLAKQHTFLADFGMLTTESTPTSLLMRGYDGFPYLFVGRKAEKHQFVGLGFSAASREALAALAKATSKPIEQLHGPGAGEVVRLEDPNGTQVEVCFGVEHLEATETRNKVLPANTPNEKVRVNQGQRAPLEPSPVRKLGHCVMGANNMEEVCEWYMRHVGLIPSDVQCIDNGDPVIAFMRLDRGDQLADHHCVVIGKGAGNGYLHSAYEVIDLDAIGQGQQFLKNKGYEHVWGIGRHILGSQLFDYWEDPYGSEFEHYADGDVFNAEHPTTYHPMDPGNVYAWGQDMPTTMLKPDRKQIMDIVGGLFKGTITIKWLKSALKATSRPARPWIK
ncbi:MAG: hypothetical protein ACI9JM_001299 [Halioglobus sp.]|jgi:hypothetical protein